MTTRGAEAALTFSALSVAVAVKLLAPSIRVTSARVKFPCASALTVPMVPVPEEIFTVEPASAVPFKVTMAILVGVGEATKPGGAGAMESRGTVTVANPVLPARSTVRAVMTFTPSWSV